MDLDKILKLGSLEDQRVEFAIFKAMLILDNELPSSKRNQSSISSSFSRSEGQTLKNFLESVMSPKKQIL